MKRNRVDAVAIVAKSNPLPPEATTGWVDSPAGTTLREYVVALPTPRRRALGPAWTPKIVVRGCVAALVLSLGAASFRQPPATTPSEELRRESPVGGLEAMSQVAAAQSIPGLGSGSVRYTKTKSLVPQFVAGASPYKLTAQRIREVWLLPDGSGRTRTETVSADFPSIDDEKSWEDSGSPSLDVPASERTFGAGELSVVDYRNLPTDDALLFDWIEDRSRLSGPGLHPEMFIVVGDLLRDGWIYPELRASLFRVTARIPGVQLQEQVTDPDGRRGVAVSLTYDNGNGNQAKLERIFDPQSTQLLSETMSIVGTSAPPMPKADQSPADLQAAQSPIFDVPAGTVVESTVYLVTAMVSEVGERPHN